jgi:suppressor for copper-sensitivity B
MILCRLIPALVLCLVPWLSAGSPAHAAATAWVGDQRAAVRLITATDSVSSKPVLDAGIEFRFGKSWHGYWRTPGDAGIAPQFDWSGSENIARHDLNWPAPHRLVVEDLQNSVYDGSVVLPVKLLLKSAGAAVRLDVSVNYGVCSEVCVPNQAHLSLVLPMGSGAESREANLISFAQKAIPGSAEAAGIAITGTRIAGTGSAQNLIVDLRSTGLPFIKPDLFIEGIGDGIPSAPSVTFDDDRRTVHLTVKLPSQSLSGKTLTATLTDDNRTAEFSVQAGEPASTGTANP